MCHKSLPVQPDELSQLTIANDHKITTSSPQFWWILLLICCNVYKTSYYLSEWVNEEGKPEGGNVNHRWFPLLNAIYCPIPITPHPHRPSHTQFHDWISYSGKNHEAWICFRLHHTHTQLPVKDSPRNKHQQPLMRKLPVWILLEMVNQLPISWMAYYDHTLVTGISWVRWWVYVIQLCRYKLSHLSCSCVH